MNKRKKNKTETVKYESPDRATLESALDSMSTDAESYRIELEDVRARNRALEMELDLEKERKRELERTIVTLATELSMARSIMRSENYPNLFRIFVTSPSKRPY
jgi:regulator of replication initiation timing